MAFRLTDHAEKGILERGVTREQVLSVLDRPEQVVDVPKGRKIYQSRVELNDKMYLVRVIIDPSEDPAVVVTAYRTSKVAKYWRRP